MRNSILTLVTILCATGSLAEDREAEYDMSRERCPGSVMTSNGTADGRTVWTTKAETKGTVTSVSSHDGHTIEGKSLILCSEETALMRFFDMSHGVEIICAGPILGRDRVHFTCHPYTSNHRGAFTGG